jgi:hypothetical protein
MRAEVINTAQPPVGVVEAIEDVIAYFKDEPDDGRFHAAALETAEEFWQSLDIAAIVEAITSQIPPEVLNDLVEQHSNVLQECLNQAIQNAWRLAVDKMMTNGVSADRLKYLERIQAAAKV